MSLKDKQNIVVDEREALSAYFNALLLETAEQVAPAAEVVVAEPQVKVVLAPQEVVEVETVTTSMVTETESQPVLPIEPEWGREKFQVMLFKVSGLSLAVPLAELNGVQEWVSDAITPMPGHAPWYLGLVNYRDKQVPVIDTARFVMPEDRLNMLNEDI
ncbi:MAG: chemotaxis protein CheW, partial [Gammaproteobacteria bacterium]|nr:chemotaxis protein CheW [Gammaproteobacteria bacterium]